MHGHDPHGVEGFGHGRLFLLPVPVPMLKEGGEGGTALSLRHMDDFQKTAEEGGLGGVAFPQAQAGERLASEIVGRQQPRIRVEGRDPCFPDVREILAEGHEQRQMAALGGAPGDGPVLKSLRREANEREEHLPARKEGPEGQIVTRGIEKGQERRQLLHKGVLGQKETVVGHDRDAFFHEPSRHLRRAAVGADEDGDVPPRAALAHGVHAIQQFPADFLIQIVASVAVHPAQVHVALALAGGKLLFGSLEAFLKQAALFRKQAFQQIGRGIPGQHGREYGAGRGRIGKLAEKGVVRFHDGPAAPPVGGQGVDSGGGGHRAQFPVAADFVKEGRVAAAPAVNGLLHVADPRQRAAPGKRLQYKRVDGPPLFAARVLKFVHKDMGQARSPDGRRPRGPRSRRTAPDEPAGG